MPDSKQVVVIGGGISGLSCAYKLQQRGVPVTLLEASDCVGGMMGTVEKEGFLFESGPQSFQGTETLLQLIRELGIESELRTADPKAPRYVLRNGKASENSHVSAGDCQHFPARDWARAGKSSRSRSAERSHRTRRNPLRNSCAGNSATKFSNISCRHSFPACTRAIPKS